ncbi:MAG: 1-acyl-sn-glycerol-3-phosphate acyltransferase [Halofilum sp. (in: g-proteobacteria)]|nr:1-acyl-sn-glycerol-3-phosphate acyltransferase [Halofilum sp. (in: g-proteobacteria)]
MVETDARADAGTGRDPMKLYQVLIRFFRVVNRLYFADIQAFGRRRVPKRGPVLLAANHPGSILDAILLSTQFQRPIRYLARSGLFRWPILATLFRQLGAIPVYRRHETGDHAQRNVEAFERVFRVFERGGCVGIFPEGRNSPVQQVGELRTGAARMALGAEARNDYRLGVVIVPVGILFANREFLNTAAVLRCGRPIAAADYADLHRDAPEAAVRKLTRDLQAALRRQAAHIEDLQLGELASDIAALRVQDAPRPPAAGPRPSALRRWLRALAGSYRRGRSRSEGQALLHRVHDRQRIAATLARAARTEPEAVTELRRRLERYHDHLDQTRLRRTLARTHQRPLRGRWPRVRFTVYALAMAPVAGFGLVHNAVPYFFARWLARRFRDDAVRLFASFMLGVLAFGATYAGIGVWLYRDLGLGAAWTAAYMALLPPTGLAALGYRRSLFVYRDRILVRTLLSHHRDLANRLRRERGEILEAFHALAERHRA